MVVVLVLIAFLATLACTLYVSLTRPCVSEK